MNQMDPSQGLPPEALMGLLQMLMGGDQMGQQQMPPQGQYDQIGSALQQLLSRRMGRLGMEEQPYPGQELDPETMENLVRMLMMMSQQPQDMGYGMEGMGQQMPPMGGDMGYGPAQIGGML